MPHVETSPVGPPPPFDPELVPVLKVINEVVPPDAFADLAKARETAAAKAAAGPGLAEFARDGAFTVEERRVPGPEGAPDVALLLCLPTGAVEPFPLLYHAHGGGMILGDYTVGLPDALDLAQEVGGGVVSVEYRLAPETPHPGPVEDCYAGLVWTAEHAEELGADPSRIVVGGGSAGGGLAAALALLARDRGGPSLAGQLLLCPMLDDRNDTPSAVQMAGLGVWDRTSNHAGWTALLGDARGTEDVSPYAAPARATDLANLPPAFVDVGSAETFRDEDVAYATGIWRAGGQAELHVWPGGFHGFDLMAPHTALAREARAARARWLRRLLGG
ncbi:alpha/beta hydrolase [Actinocorallia sp. API 0066]|uniref:alpha/beta hydrolase n=1 Tax=Actinocorallia sp. API 0066 TaxID=2896846 RepID=UPI001E4D7DB8|nr:alpha/beta hydrolase [Actinocorallia sp. API 0066]MCD0449784.1 alpha/beta hydrolase [Actinocorallia sp. API 0066]